MVLGEEQQEVGQFGMGTGMSLSQQERLQLNGRRERVSQLSYLFLAIGEGPVRRSFCRRPPGVQELMAAFPQLTKQKGQDLTGPAQSTPDPAPDLARRQKVEALG